MSGLYVINQLGEWMRNFSAENHREFVGLHSLRIFSLALTGLISCTVINTVSIVDLESIPNIYFNNKWADLLSLPRSWSAQKLILPFLSQHTVWIAQYLLYVFFFSISSDFECSGLITCFLNGFIESPLASVLRRCLVSRSDVNRFYFLSATCKSSV